MDDGAVAFSSSDCEPRVLECTKQLFARVIRSECAASAHVGVVNEVVSPIRNA
jgi:hypothetical protein